jgi:hypothetical protein
VSSYLSLSGCVATASLSYSRDGVSSKLAPMYIGCYIEAVKILWHQSDGSPHAVGARPPIGLVGLKLCAPDFIFSAAAAAGCGL